MEKFSNAVTLLRIPFSVFLMPVFWFAFINVEWNESSLINAIIVFLILHLLVYPASNGYNSYCDKDEESIGGLEKPPVVNEYLIYLVIAFDALAVLLSFLLSWQFAMAILAYLLVSKAYSWPGIRLKKFPILSTVVVTLFQGAFTYYTVLLGIEGSFDWNSQYLPALVSTLFLAGSYPITQIYQHGEDSRRGDKTLSIMLGIKGTFFFAAGMFVVASALMALWLENWIAVILYFVATGPVGMYFSSWMLKSLKDKSQVNFVNTMKMNKISSLSLSATFVLLKVYMEVF